MDKLSITTQRPLLCLVLSCLFLAGLLTIPSHSTARDWGQIAQSENEKPTETEEELDEDDC